MSFIQKMIELFLTKKKIIAYVSALIIAAVAGFLGMTSQEVKDAVVSGPVINPPQMTPIVPVIPAAPPAQVKK